MLKCLRYQAIPVDNSAISFLKASSSFQAYGTVTAFQLSSLKAVSKACSLSPTKTFQPGLKLYFTRCALEEKQYMPQMKMIRILLITGSKFIFWQDTSPVYPALFPLWRL